MSFRIKRLHCKLLISIAIIAVITVMLQYQLIVEFEDAQDNSLRSKCEVIHIGLICSSFNHNYNIIDLHVMLKSIYFYRSTPLHFHVMVDKSTEKILKTLFDTWNIPQVNLSLYNINNFVPYMVWNTTSSMASEFFTVLKLKFIHIISPKITSKIIVMDTDILLAGNIIQLWSLFRSFNSDQIVGIVEDQTNKYLKKDIQSSGFTDENGSARAIMLYDLKRIIGIEREKLLKQLTKDVPSSLHPDELYLIKKVLETDSDIVYRASCQWDVQSNYTCTSNITVLESNPSIHLNDVESYRDYYLTQYNMFLTYNGSLLRRQLDECEVIQSYTSEHTNTTEPLLDECSDFRTLQTHKWRTLLYFRKFQHTAIADDVTLISQLSYDRFNNVEEISNQWDGPMSITLYLTESEFQECLSYIENSKILKNRLDIAYHVVFKDGQYYPINYLRNTAMRNIVTPYVFLSDIDFIPAKDSYQSFREHLGGMKTMERKALVVPAFEANATLPQTKNELLNMLSKTVFQFHYKYYNAGHAPVNYKKWKTAEKPYKIRGRKAFEPYIIVERNVTDFDTRFFGFGWDKVSHTRELQAQGYEFIVLPDVFVVHKNHPRSVDRMAFLRVKRYRECLKQRQREFVEYMRLKYFSTAKPKISG